MFQPRVILHPTDYSDCSAYAFQIAADLARKHQAQLLVLHVAETLGPENVTYGEATSQQEPKAYQQRLWDHLRQTVPSPPGIAMQYLLAEGNAAPEIERAVKEHQVDLIVLGTHGRTGLRRLFTGSIAEQIVRLASCPVLTCKLPTPNTGATT